MKANKNVTNEASDLLPKYSSRLALVLGLIFTGCSSKYETNQPRIDGDWILMEYPAGIEIGPVGLRFMDDTLYTITDGGFVNEGVFIMKDDTLITRDFDQKFDKQRIQKLTDDTLVLTGLYLDKKYYSRKLEFIDNLKFDNIEIVAGTCFGDCPEFILNLTDAGLINFKPKLNCKSTEQVEFILGQEKMKKIDSLFKWTYLHKLDTTRTGAAVDDWAFEIAIIFNQQKIKLKTTHDYIPHRLKGIFHLLIDELVTRRLI
ncbi:hypothetical protein [Chryseolinea sp. H1M3-3]|uniref:DUF6438 domain-containing protein n=1 Tax=Chryseolinea sp. H1M3-3 TaxID=3034144 RepID=UPI0023ED3E49|nr:hypothetical protein [Chryseolinea sp. H1M3-3]